MEIDKNNQEDAAFNQDSKLTDSDEKVDNVEGVEEDLFGKNAKDERLEENHEASANSNVTTNLFSKDHHRTSKPFGPGHEPGGAV